MSVIFMSVNFMPGHLVRQFHVRHFQSTPEMIQQWQAAVMQRFSISVLRIEHISLDDYLTLLNFS